MTEWVLTGTTAFLLPFLVVPSDAAKTPLSVGESLRKLPYHAGKTVKL